MLFVFQQIFSPKIFITQILSSYQTSIIVVGVFRLLFSRMLTDVLHLFRTSWKTSSRKESDDVRISPEDFKSVEGDAQKVKIFECF